MYDKTKESDWRKFRTMVPELRERYLRRQNAELVAILQDESRTPTERFWAAEKRIEEQAEILRDCLDGHTRSKMPRFILCMRRYEMIDAEDLQQFSDELQVWIESVSDV